MGCSRATRSPQARARARARNAEQKSTAQKIPHAYAIWEVQPRCGIFPGPAALPLGVTRPSGRPLQHMFVCVCVVCVCARRRVCVCERETGCRAPSACRSRNMPKCGSGSTVRIALHPAAPRSYARGGGARGCQRTGRSLEGRCGWLNTQPAAFERQHGTKKTSALAGPGLSVGPRPVSHPPLAAIASGSQCAARRFERRRAAPMDRRERAAPKPAPAPGTLSKKSRAQKKPHACAISGSATKVWRLHLLTLFCRRPGLSGRSAPVASLALNRASHRTPGVCWCQCWKLCHTSNFHLKNLKQEPTHKQKTISNLRHKLHM